MTDFPWKARCECGHIQGEHRTSGAGFPHPIVYGLCRAPGCDCREYSDPAPQPEQEAAA